jgi:hypothetical protein
MSMNDHGSFDKAIKHFIIAAGQGYEGSLELLKEFYQEGKIRKEVLASALRAYQAAIDATKSRQRQAIEDDLMHRAMLAEFVRTSPNGE